MAGQACLSHGLSKGSALRSARCDAVWVHACTRSTRLCACIAPESIEIASSADEIASSADEASPMRMVSMGWGATSQRARPHRTALGTTVSEEQGAGPCPCVTVGESRSPEGHGGGRIG